MSGLQIDDDGGKACGHTWADMEAEDDAGKLVGMVYGEGRRDRPAQGVADHDRPLDPEAFQQAREDARMTARQVNVVPAAPARMAVSGPVDEDQPAPALQEFEEDAFLLAQIAAGAMDENDRQQIGVFARRVIGIVQAHVADVGEPPLGRIVRRDLAGQMPARSVKERDRNGAQKQQEFHRIPAPGNPA